MPREYTHFIAVVVVYIPPRTTLDVACDVIHETVTRAQTLHPEAFTFITEDFNQAGLSAHLTGFVQYVDCPTRKNKAFDLLYANAMDIYIATAFPPLGKSDHNLVLLLPNYKPWVVCRPVSTRTFRKWTPEARETLRACFDYTVWAAPLKWECFF